MKKRVLCKRNACKRNDGGKIMSTDLTALIQDAFSECYALDEVARLYFDIRMECEKQLEYMNIQIAKQMQENGVEK